MTIYKHCELGHGGHQSKYYAFATLEFKTSPTCHICRAVSSWDGGVEFHPKVFLSLLCIIYEYSGSDPKPTPRSLVVQETTLHICYKLPVLLNWLICLLITYCISYRPTMTSLTQPAHIWVDYNPETIISNTKTQTSSSSRSSGTYRGRVYCGSSTWWGYRARSSRRFIKLRRWCRRHIGIAVSSMPL